MKLLLVEDDPGIGRFVSRGLPRHGYAVTWHRQAEGVLALVRTGGFAVLLLDLGLPDGDGLDLCRALRTAGLRIPVLMLTARGALRDRLDGFEVGADDYLAKPFAFEELAARLAVLVRRGGERLPDPLRFGTLALDAVTRGARVGEVPLPLSRREFDLLATLVRGDGRIVDRHALATGMWGNDIITTDNALDVYVGYVRRRLAGIAGAPGIETVRGRGYRLAHPHAREAQA